MINGIEVVSKPQIASKNKARSDEKAQHTWKYVSILKKTATPLLDVRWGFEIIFLYIPVFFFPGTPRALRFGPRWGS